MQSDSIAPLTKVHGAQVIKDRLRDLQNAMRQTRNARSWRTSSGYSQELERTLGETDSRAELNLTGTVIHTNLGRASQQRNRGET